MRPNRAVVIRHGAVARLIDCNRSDSPPGERGLASEGGRSPAGAIFRCDPGKEAVAGVGGKNPARSLAAIESQGIGGEILAPESLLKALPQASGFGGQFLCLSLQSQR